MARIFATACPAADIALSGGTPKSVVQTKAPTNQRLAVTEVGVGFDGTSPTAAPILVELLLQTTGDGTFTSLTPVRTNKTKGTSETIQAVCGHTASVEPTSMELIKAWKIHPQAPTYAWVGSLSRPVEVPGGGSAVVRITAPASANCRPYIDFEE